MDFQLQHRQMQKNVTTVSSYHAVNGLKMNIERPYT